MCCKMRPIIVRMRAVSESQTSAIDPEQDCPALGWCWARGSIHVQIQAIFAFLWRWILKEQEGQIAHRFRICARSTTIRRLNEIDQLLTYKLLDAGGLRFLDVERLRPCLRLLWRRKSLRRSSKRHTEKLVHSRRHRRKGSRRTHHDPSFKSR